MSPSDLPKLWAEPTKIGQIWKTKILKTILVKSWSPSPIFFKKLERFNQFSTLRLFIILISLTVTLFSEKMLIFTGCISTWFHVQLDQKIFDGFLPSCSIMPQVNNTSTPKSFWRRRMRSSMSTSGWKSPEKRKNREINAITAIWHLHVVIWRIFNWKLRKNSKKRE